MFRRLKRRTRSTKGSICDQTTTIAGQVTSGERISSELDVNRHRIESAYGNSTDLALRELQTGIRGKVRVLIVHIDGLVDKRLVSENVIERITDPSCDWGSSRQVYSDLRDRLLSTSQVKEVSTFDELLSLVSSGNCGVLVDGVPFALVSETKGWASRALQEPTTEATIRGSKEGFVESLRVNTSLLRRRLKSHELRIEQIEIGTLSRTEVAIAYISSLADEKIVQEVRNRLGKVDVDAIQDSGHLEEYIEDAPFSPFPTILRTERPDKVTGALLEGRVGILVDGTPFALIVPATFSMFLTASEDYYERYFIGTALRFIRALSFIISLSLPAFYVAITTFHQELLPTPLILSIAAQREGVPFPAFVEALLMELMFEMLREAGVRLPRIVGPAVSIIGALVLGDAAIRAGLVSPAMVVVVAGTGIASFATPVFSLAIGVRLMRFVMIVLAATLGLFGMGTGIFALFMHLTALRSFGVPYMEPLAPIILSDLKDALFRAPWWAMRTRPKLVGQRNPVRQAPNLKPEPLSAEERQVTNTESESGSR